MKYCNYYQMQTFVVTEQNTNTMYVTEQYSAWI
jgi:hypothetical protein